MFYEKEKLKPIIVILILLFMLNTNVYAKSGKIETNTLNLVPVREVFEKLGFEVMWDQTNKNVILVKGENEIILTNDSKKIDIANGIFGMEIIDGLSYLELENINSIGYEYEYIDSTNILIFQRIDISNKKPIISSETINKGDLNVLNDNTKPKLLFFWASWCPYCTEYINEINMISDNELGDFEIIAINIDEKSKKHEIGKFLQNNLINVRNILDFDKEIFSYYNPKVIPTSYIINESGVIVELKIGTITKEEILGYQSKL